MTNEELYDRFVGSIGNIKPIDYRPLCKEFIPETEGIVVWNQNGDVYIYYPKVVEHDK